MKTFYDHYIQGQTLFRSNGHINQHNCQTWHQNSYVYNKLLYVILWAGPKDGLMSTTWNMMSAKFYILFIQEQKGLSNWTYMFLFMFAQVYNSNVYAPILKMENCSSKTYAMNSTDTTQQFNSIYFKL